jgi:hypothetical protein
MGNIRIGDRWEYFGQFPERFYSGCQIISINPITIQFHGSRDIDGPYTLKEFQEKVMINYRLCEVIRVRNILDRYED